MATFIFMQTRVFRNEMQIRHIEKHSYACFSLKNAEVGQRKAVYRKTGRLRKHLGKKNSVQRVALALRRVQENLILQRIILFCVQCLGVDPNYRSGVIAVGILWIVFCHRLF